MKYLMCLIIVFLGVGCSIEKIEFFKFDNPFKNVKLSSEKEVIEMEGYGPKEEIKTKYKFGSGFLNVEEDWNFIKNYEIEDNVYSRHDKILEEDLVEVRFFVTGRVNNSFLFFSLIENMEDLPVEIIKELNLRD